MWYVCCNEYFSEGAKRQYPGWSSESGDTTVLCCQTRRDGYCMVWRQWSVWLSVEFWGNSFLKLFEWWNWNITYKYHIRLNSFIYLLVPKGTWFFLLYSYSSSQCWYVSTVKCFPQVSNHIIWSNNFCAFGQPKHSRFTDGMLRSANRFFL